MAQSEDLTNVQYHVNNIQRILSTKIEEARQRCLEHFPKPIHVLLAMDDNVQDQLEQQLQQERRNHSGERIILIPYCLENAHWIGILIEFQNGEQIRRAEYINPVNESDIIPDRLGMH